MRVNLPMDLLRSFVAIAETGSMVRASEHIFLTQSALSLQMKKLAEIVQHPLFHRQQGARMLTAAGDELLSYAREILALNDRAVTTLEGKLVGPVRIGMVQDFADAILTNVLSRFKRLNPDIRMEVRIGNSGELREQVASDLLDIALYLSEHSHGATVSRAKMAWLGDPALLNEQPLPIAMMSRPCIFRDASIAALERAGQPYSVMLETPSISVLRAALESGLALTCRTGAFAGPGLARLEIGNIPLPDVAYNLAMQDVAHSAVDSLARLLRTALNEL